MRAVFLFGAASVSGLILVACSSRPAPDAASSFGAVPVVSTPLATSVDTSQGSWATVPMGRLDQPLNTFWQLFFRPTGSNSWSNEVEATAVATNGGLILAPAGQQSLVVGIRPSNLLKFSPLIATSDAGRSWSNGLIVRGLAKHPDAMAADADGMALALVDPPSGAEVLASDQDLSKWHTLITGRELAAAPGARDCGLDSITAVAYAAGSVVIGGGCSRPGAVGMLLRRGGAWQLAAVAMPKSLAHGEVGVLGLEPMGGGLGALLEVGRGSRLSIVAAWSADGASWITSEPLTLAGGDHLASFGPASASGLFVISSRPSGSETLEAVAGPGSSWTRFPAPPRQTATVSFGPAGTVSALSAKGSVLDVWILGAGSRDWSHTQSIRVPIVFGSSE